MTWTLLIIISNFLAPCLGVALRDRFYVMDTEVHGGCDDSQISQLEAAYAEAMLLVRVIRGATLDMLAKSEPPSQGHLFQELFGPTASEDLPGARTAVNGAGNILLRIVRLMDATIAADRPEAQAIPPTQRTRIYCSSLYIVITSVMMNATTGEEIQPLQPLGQQVYWSPLVDEYINPSRGVVNVAETVCSDRTLAATSPRHLTITFCPQVFWNDAGRTIPRPPTLASAGRPPLSLRIHLDNYNTLSKIFLHELMHLMGTGSEIPDVTLQPEQYGFDSSRDLRLASGSDVALRNADSYAVLATGLFFWQFDWRSGVRRLLSFYASNLPQGGS